MTDAMPPDIQRLLDHLREQFGDALRSVVEYLPQSRSIHYVRHGIDREVAEARLVRINELYQVERLSTHPVTADPELDRLEASIHLFASVIVVHLVDHGGRIVGFSLDADAVPEPYALVRECQEAAFLDESA